MRVFFLRLVQKGFRLADRRKLLSGKSDGESEKGLLYLEKQPIHLCFQLICFGKYTDECGKKMYI